MITTDAYSLFEKARKNCPNPFKLQEIISASEVWGKVMTNLPSLNEHIDKAIFDAVFEVRHNYSHQIGIAIKGDRGTGKSHIIYRTWRKIAEEGGALFGYISPCSNPKRINSHVRFDLVDSFDRRDVRGVTQWQKLAASIIAKLEGTELGEKYRPYIERCNSPKELKKYIKANVAKENLKIFFDELVEAILEIEPDIDLNFLKALLFLLSYSKDSSVALYWIKGVENPEFQRLGLPEFHPEEQEDKSIWMIEQICKLGKHASLPVLICFDQIDNFGTDSDSGDSPPETVARCIDKIYFQCSNVILICCLLSDAWRQIEHMGSGIPDRVGQRLIMAKPPTVEEMIELVKQRLNWFYQENNLNKNNYPDLYPFEESQIKKIASQGAGVRSLMQWCAEKFEAEATVIQETIIEPENPPEDKNKKFLEIYTNLLDKIDISINEDDKLAAIIGCSIKMISEIGTTENVVVDREETMNRNSHDLHLIVSGYDSIQQSNIKIGIRVCETTNGNSFNAVIKRLVDYKKYGITRGCLVRSTEIPRNWKIGTKLKEQLVNELKGEVIDLKKDEIKPLVVIQTIYEQAENYDFSKEQVINFVKDLKLATDNPLIRAILGAT